jgi:hypothetical protein
MKGFQYRQNLYLIQGIPQKFKRVPVRAPSVTPPFIKDETSEGDQQISTGTEISNHFTQQILFSYFISHVHIIAHNNNKE